MNHGALGEGTTELEEIIVSFFMQSMISQTNDRALCVVGISWAGLRVSDTSCSRRRRVGLQGNREMHISSFAFDSPSAEHTVCMAKPRRM